MLGISRSIYYRIPTQPHSEKLKDEKAVIHCFEENDGRYGRIRIRKALRFCGINISEYRISRILKANGLCAKAGRRKKSTKSRPTEQQYIEENLIWDKFSVEIPNYLWCSDITEIKYKNGKLYVCGVIDSATRRIVGWSISRNPTQKLVQEAFKMAAGRNPIIPENAIYHSDRGCQYTAKATKKLIVEYGFRKSMSRPGTPNDNQPIESFWNTLETELGSLKQYTYEEAERRIVEYIELYYNTDRLHSGIGYRTPNEVFTLLSVRRT